MASKKMKGCGGGGAIAAFGFIALLLTGFLGFFDAVFVRARLQERQARAHWDQVPAEVTVSTVHVSHGAESETYTPRIHFQYRVNGRELTGKRYTFFDRIGAGEQHAIREAKSYPMGSTVTAYVNPDDPAEAVISVDGSALPKIIFLFLTPFHCAAFALLAAAFGAARRRRTQGGLSDLEYRYVHFSDAHHFVIRRRPWAPHFSFFGILGLLGFLASFVVAFSGADQLAPHVLGACILAAAAITRYFVKRAARPDNFLHVDRESQTFAYPADGERVEFSNCNVIDVESSATKVTINDRPIFRHEIRIGEGSNAATMYAFKGPIEEGEELRGIIDEELGRSAEAAAA